MNALPIIKSSGPPPERYAERMAVEFARWLCAEEQRRQPLWDAVFESSNDGNPKGQTKMVEGLSRISNTPWRRPHAGEAPQIHAEPLPHGRLGQRHLIDPDGPVPPAPWLALIAERIVATYAETKHDQLVIGLICQHAIARLAERCGARDPHDLTVHARNMAQALLKLNKTANRNAMPEGGWRAPFKDGIAVVRLDEATGFPLVTTVLPPEESIRTRIEIA
jgi:hypothetical protein